MCGITGMFRRNGLIQDSARVQVVLDQMTASLTHRGPDQSWTSIVQATGTASTPIAALGVRRLAIVDVRGGIQPATDASRRFHVCLNGEIYNHERIRQELEAEGVPFRGEGDAEAVAQLVAQVGIHTAVDRLVGQFALAIVDRETRQLWLFRDRMGQKPLYWTITGNGTLVWGSELRALRPVPEVEWVSNPTALQALLLWEYIPSPLTPWRSIHKLPPGGRLHWGETDPQVDRWYEPPVPRAGRGGDHGQWAKSIRGSLQVAVLQRLRADVEVGSLLSGGIDSTLVCALAQAHLSKPLTSFGVSIRTPTFDEGPHARSAAAAIGTFHQQIPLEAPHIEALSARVFAHMDEPLADSSLLPTWLLMDAVARSGIKCVLSGDGADELFAGYPTTLAHRLVPLLRVGSSAARRMLSRRRVQQGGVSKDYMARRLFEAVHEDFPWRHQTWMGAWLPEELGARQALDGLLADAAYGARDADPASRALHLDQRLYLADGVLVKVDRASMAHGVEVRSPFLDHRVVELAADIGIDHKVGLPGARSLARGGVFRGKRVLKTAAAPLVPEFTRRRPKKGFGAPVGPWLATQAPSALEPMVEAVADLVPPDRLRVVIREHQMGLADHRRRLWSCWTLHRWRESEWGRAPCSVDD